MQLSLFFPASYDRFFNMNLIVGFAGIVVTRGTSIWTRGFGADMSDGSGNSFGVEFDPMSDRSTVGTDGGRFSLPGGITWQENADVTTTGAAVVGLGPNSAFIAKHQIVTFMPTKGKMIVGPFDASPACREGRMSFAPQAANATRWKIPLVWNATFFGIETVNFDISFREDVFSVPHRLSRAFYLYLQRQISIYSDRGDTYTLTSARADMPTIRLLMDAYELQLTSRDYMMSNQLAGEIYTSFYSSYMRDPVLPNSVMKRMIVQFDALNDRVGICNPK